MRKLHIFFCKNYSLGEGGGNRTPCPHLRDSPVYWTIQNIECKGYLTNSPRFREAAKKSLFFSGPATKRGGGGVRAESLKKTKKDVVTELEGVRGKGLVAGPLKKETFCGFPNMTKGLNFQQSYCLFNSCAFQGSI